MLLYVEVDQRETGGRLRGKFFFLLVSEVP